MTFKSPPEVGPFCIPLPIVEPKRPLKRTHQSYYDLPLIAFVTDPQMFSSHKPSMHVED